MGTFTENWILQFLIILSIFVLLVNSKELNYTLLEEKGLNFQFGNVREDFNLRSYLTSDEDYKDLKYSIVLSNEFAKYFSIDEKSSSLSTKLNIDRENLTHCEFTADCVLSFDVIAKGTVGTFFKRIKIKVYILDKNDNHPTFVKDTNSIVFSEASVPGTYKTMDGAVDADSEVNSVTRYEILENNVPFSVDFQQLFDGSSIVKIIVDQSLDAETKSNYQIHVLAIDGGAEPFTGTATVSITVADENDNTPTFKQSTYNITVNESAKQGTEILRVTAMDKDSGNNGKITYRLSPHQKEVLRTLFEVNSTTGSLSLLKTLVYEPGEVYHVIVEATDNAKKPRFSQTSVFVKVNDSSNDAPKINVNLLSNEDVAKISENAKTGAAVAHIGVTDDDMGNNGVVTCRVLRNYFFSIESLGISEFKVVVQQPLNREAKEEHEVTVLCEDKGSPSLNSTATFIVKILDENDHSPRFTKPIYQDSILENNRNGASVLQVTATDVDIGINAEVEYSLNVTNGYDFSIDQQSGVIHAISNLDRENVTNITFWVIAKDKGNPQRSSSAVVKLIILDENDNPPEFSKTVYTFTVKENSNSRMLIGTVNATDVDSGENGTVEFILSPDSMSGLPFEVLPNGTLYTKESLDRESVPYGYNFNIRAYDLGNPQLHNVAHVTVFIEDVNDNAPTILYPRYDNKTVKIVYNMSPSSLLTKVKANDRDLNQNSELTFSIENRDMDNIFHIDSSSGEIFLARPLTKDDIQTYTFTIVVEDQGTPKRSSRENLTIIVTPASSAPTSPESGSTYLIIVIAISCVTVILSVTIILVICIIRNRDRNVKKQHNKETTATDGRQMYDSIDRNAENDKRAEKKVSFSIDSHPAVCLSANSKNNISQTDLAVEEILDRIMPPDLPEKTTRVQNPQNPTLPTAARLQRHQEYLQSQDKHWASHNLEVVLKRQDDNHSETSGETTTSDSGRGGSESDIQSSGGLSHCLELDYLKNMYSPANSPGKQTSSRQQESHIDSIPHHKKQLNHYKNPPHLYNHSDSPIQNKMVHQKYPPTDLRGRRHKALVSPTDFRGRNNVHWKGISDMLNNSMATIEDYDEDDNTTTSGSYTVEDQDIRSELSHGMDCIV